MCPKCMKTQIMLKRESATSLNEANENARLGDRVCEHSLYKGKATPMRNAKFTQICGLREREGEQV